MPVAWHLAPRSAGRCSWAELNWTELNWSGVELSRAEAQVACSREITDNLLNMAQQWSMCSFGQAKRESAGAGTPSLSCYSARTTLSSLAQSLDFHWVGHTDRKRKRSGALGEFRSRDILPDTFASQSASLSECVCGVCGCVWVFVGVSRSLCGCVFAPAFLKVVSILL